MNNNNNNNNQTFYKQIRGFMILLNVTGLFPAENVFNLNGKKLKLKYIHICYSLILYIIIIYILIYNSKKSKLIIINQLIYTLSPIILWIYSCKDICEFYKQMEILKEIIYNLPGNKKKIGKQSRAFKFYIRVILINIYTEISLFIAIEENKNETFITNLSLILLRLPRYQMPIMYVFFCEELIQYFGNIEKSFSVCYNNLYNIEKVRLSYAKVRIAVDKLNACSGPLIVFYVLFSLYELMAKYYYLIVFYGLPNIGDIFIIIRIYYTLHSMTTSAENLFRVSRRIILTIRRIPTTKLNNQNQQQISYFLTHIEALPLDTTVSGFFNLRRSLILSMLAGVVTQFTVVAQLAPDLRNWH